MEPILLFILLILSLVILICLVISISIYRSLNILKKKILEMEILTQDNKNKKE
jgi:hypothetical protein